MAPEQGPDSKSQCGKKETTANEEDSAQQYESNKHDNPSTVSSIPPKCILPDSEIMAIIQRWNLTYSGDTELMEFLERSEELAECYYIPPDRLLPAMLSILQGNALKWYRVKRNMINTWLGFKAEIQKFFLPPRYLSQLEKNFYNRKQYTRERAKDYILTMLTLSRQHPQLSKINHLDRIYDGLRTEYRHYVRRNDFTNLDELISITDEFEALKREEHPQTSHMMRESMYNRASRCWRCKRIGHKRINCTYSFRLFCSYCGQDGVLSRACSCHNIHHPALERTVPTSDSRYYIFVEVYGRKVRALIDTGASRTYIGEDLKQHLLNMKIKPISSEGMVQMADQSLVSHLDIFSIEVIYQDNKVPLRTSAIKTLAEQMILGMDFVSAMDFDIRINGKTLKRSCGTHESEHVCALTSKEMLPDEEERKLAEMLEYRKREFSEVKILSTVSSHEIQLKHPKLIKQGYMPRKRSKSHKVKTVATQTNIPIPYTPPPEARLRIISNLQVKYPRNLSPATAAPRRVRITHNVVQETPVITTASPHNPNQCLVNRNTTEQHVSVSSITSISPVPTMLREIRRSIPDITTENRPSIAKECPPLPPLKQQEATKMAVEQQYYKGPLTFKAAANTTCKMKFRRFREDEVFKDFKIHRPQHNKRAR